MKRFRKYSASIVVLLLLVPLYFAARPIALPESGGPRLAGRFAFQKMVIPTPASAATRSVREVHPSLQRISAWVSTLGAAVTLADLDRDGLPNDLILVDPRTDLVTVLPAPGTGARFASFVLDASPLPYRAEATAPMGALAGDFNEDGLMDVLTYYWGRTPVIFLRKEGAAGGGELSRVDFLAIELMPGGERWYSNGATQADLDGDGHVDLLIGNYFQDGAHILDARATGTEVMHAGKAKALNGGLKHVFLWQEGITGATPAVRYKEVTGVFDDAVNRGWTLAAGASDLDGDLLPEIYFAFDFGPDRLLHNRSTPGHLEFALLTGRRDLTTPKSCVLGFDSFKGMGCDFGDLNGDGIPEIYVSNIATKFGLTESHFLWLSNGNLAGMQSGHAPYTHGAEKLGLARSGWGWDCKLADFDNDGILEAVQANGFIRGSINRWPELQALGTSNDQVVHNPRFWPSFKPGSDLSGHDLNAFFVREDDGRYYNIGTLTGFDEPMVSRGIAPADVDGDGRLDFAVANQWGDSYLYKNIAANPRAFLGLHLLLPVGGEIAAPMLVKMGHPATSDRRGRPAIGAQATVHLPDGRKLSAQVDGGNGHSGRRSPDLHFGLGSASPTQTLSIELRWRDARGAKQKATVELMPGWHTIWLGAATEEMVAQKGVQ